MAVKKQPPPALSQQNKYVYTTSTGMIQHNPQILSISIQNSLTTSSCRLYRAYKTWIISVNIIQLLRKKAYLDTISRKGTQCIQSTHLTCNQYLHGPVKKALAVI